MPACGTRVNTSQVDNITPRILVALTPDLLLKVPSFHHLYCSIFGIISVLVILYLHSVLCSGVK